MIVLWFSVVLLISSVNSAWILSLIDLPLTMPKGNFMLHATLTDNTTGDKYFMQEFISSDQVINGVIVVDTPKDTFNVYYNIKDKDAKDNGQRLLIQNTECSLYGFKNSSGTLLPGITRRLISLLLAMGPSILYRIDHGSIIWESSPDENVRGTMMKSFTTPISNKLNITYYYKSNLDRQLGLQQPSRIVFSGTDPSYLTSIKENLILDIYLQEMDKQNDFNRIVKPTPGIGCPVYFEDNLPIPKINAKLVHMILSETVQGPITTKTVSEVHTYSKFNLLRLRTSVLGITTEALYDYGLGISVLFQDGGYCSIYPAEITAPGIDSKSGLFNLQTLFSLDGQFNYLGEVYFEHRDGFVVKAWESVQYNVTTSNGKYDKVVITQYFTETTSTDAFNGYMIVATEIYAYKLDANKKSYQLAEITTRDYMNFQTAETESEFHDKFALSACSYFTSDMTLNFQLGCTGSDCIKFAEDRVYLLKEKFKESILMNYELSPLRFGEMDVTFQSSTIDIRVDFLEAPYFENIFQKKVMFVSDDSLKLLSKISATNELDCFSKHATSFNNFDVVLYCGDNNVCGSLFGIDKIKEDDVKGHACQLVEVPLRNLQRISREIMLKDLQARLIRDTSYKTISLTNAYHMAVNYKIVDILDETQTKTDHLRELFYIYASGSNLDAKDSNVIQVPNVKTLADCYRACESSDELECRIFSYCKDTESDSCFITNMTAVSAPTDDSAKSCTIYKKNSILEYSVIKNRKFRMPSSVSQDMWAHDCAESCASDKNCKSFQSCDEVCTLSENTYTDSGTEYDEICEIYIPKVTDKYQSTGRKLVSEVFHTEVNLNLDQCAALCHEWVYGDEYCQSFNFCPKGRSTSTCSLSKYSVKDSSIKTIDSTNNCFNYQLMDAKSSTNKQSTSSNSKGTSGSAAFGIIVIFLATGLLFGLVAPIAYTKVNTLTRWSSNRASMIDQSFVWKRQVDDEQTEN